jgi:RHS repeat-associated protein
VRFTYDALGRRLSKEYDGTVTRWVWDGNLPLHEWEEDLASASVGENGEIQLGLPSDAVTWIFDEGSFSPAAKMQGGESFSIVSDYLGKPEQMYDSAGDLTWDAEYDIYGNIRKLRCGSLNDCPFRFPGQYADDEVGLYYNRFRYYDPGSGAYVSQDPIGLMGGGALYAYVHNVNSWVDPVGLSSFIFRADDNYKGGDIGDVGLGGNADIMDPYTHVQKKKTGQTSIYSSFSDSKSKVSPKFGSNVSKVKLDELKKLEAEGKIKIHTPDDIQKMIGGKKGKNAARSMRNNGEILVEGIVPADLVKKCG